MLLQNKSEFNFEGIDKEKINSLDTSIEYESKSNEYKDNDIRTEDKLDKNGGHNLDKCTKDYGTDPSYKVTPVWKFVILLIIIHILGVYGLYLCFTKAKLSTSIYMVTMALLTVQGITSGVHRLWSHRSYKARLPLKIFLLICQSLNGQNSVRVWVRDHRLHHRYSDTDGDPHNVNRGFLFSHAGWLVSKKHPLVKELARTVDLSDIEADTLIMFQDRYYKTLHFLIGFLIPVFIPVYFWNEDFWVSATVCYFTRYTYHLNITWLVNSFAHTFGTKPYDKNILPLDSKLLTMIILGEGWHNFHHTFPWDYRAGEWGGLWNISGSFINFMHYIGQAYDLKTASASTIKQRMERTGDGTTYKQLHHKAISKQL